MDKREKVCLGVAAHISDARLKQAQRVAQFLSRRAYGYINVSAGSQTVHRQSIDDPESHGLVYRASERLPHAFRQHFRDLEHGPDIRICAKHGVRCHCIPEFVVADKTWAVVRHFLIQNCLNLVPQRDQRSAFFREHQAFESANVVGMNRKEPDIFIHTFIH